jgi:hypothetical protein
MAYLYFARNTSRDAQLRLLKVAAKPALVYDSGTWILKRKNDYRPQAQPLKFFRPLAGYA